MKINMPDDLIDPEIAAKSIELDLMKDLPEQVRAQEIRFAVSDIKSLVERARGHLGNGEWVAADRRLTEAQEKLKVIEWRKGDPNA